MRKERTPGHEKQGEWHVLALGNGFTHQAQVEIPLIETVHEYLLRIIQEIMIIDVILDQSDSTPWGLGAGVNLGRVKAPSFCRPAADVQPRGGRERGQD